MSEDERTSAEMGIPEFMLEDAKAALAERMREDPAFYINLAKYAGNGVPTAEQAVLLQDVEFLRDSDKRRRRAAAIHGVEFSQDDFPKGWISLAEWKFEVNGAYPAEPLAREGLNKIANPDLPFRAIYLLESMKQLLSLVGAPPAMMSDLECLMGKHLPHAADRRAELQQALIDHPDWSDTRIAKSFKYDQTRMVKEIEDGRLIRPPRRPQEPEQP